MFVQLEWNEILNKIHELDRLKDEGYLLRSRIDYAEEDLDNVELKQHRLKMETKSI